MPNIALSVVAHDPVKQLLDPGVLLIDPGLGHPPDGSHNLARWRGRMNGAAAEIPSNHETIALSEARRNMLFAVS
jgi:hypothetical protein